MERSFRGLERGAALVPHLLWTPLSSEAPPGWAALSSAQAGVGRTPSPHLPMHPGAGRCGPAGRSEWAPGFRLLSSKEFVASAVPKGGRGAGPPLPPAKRQAMQSVEKIFC